MKNFNFLFVALIIGTCFLTASCSSDDDDDYGYNNSTQTPSSKVSQPSFEKNLTTTTTSDVSMRCRFSNGSDTWNNMSCTVHWCQYSSKPSTTPTTSDMTKHESMRQYGTTTKSTTFDKTHSGFSGGTYIYYYFECKNSKYTTTTTIKYCIVKR